MLPSSFDHAPAQASGDQDWCKDAGSYNDRDETFCEIRELKEAAQRGLDAEVGNGSVTVTGSSRSDVMVQARVTLDASNGSVNVTGVHGNIDAETTLGSGGPTLEVRTSNGSVRVAKR